MSYSTVYKVFARPFRALFRIHIHGEENLPADGGYLVCANHTSIFDVVIVSVAVRRQVMYMAKAELFRIPVIGVHDLRPPMPLCISTVKSSSRPSPITPLYSFAFCRSVRFAAVSTSRLSRGVSAARIA